MHLLWKRYNRSGAAPGWTYLTLAAGFAALCAWAAVRSDWLVFVIALPLPPLTIAGGRLLRRIDSPESGGDAAREERDDG